MLHTLFLAATVGLHPVQLSLKDTPQPIPAPSPVREYQLRIEGFQGTFKVPGWILRQHNLIEGQIISRIRARLIAAQLGYGYSPELRLILQRLDEHEKQQP